MRYPTTTPGTEWWLLSFGGVVSILFGLALLFWPGISLIVLIWVFGIYAIIYGIVRLVGMFREIGANVTWWPSLLIGVVSVFAGIAVFAWPLITLLVVIFIIAVWAIALGIVEIVGGLGKGQWLLAIAGVVSIMLGFILLANPVLGVDIVVRVIGAFAIVSGILQIIEGTRIPTVTGTPT